MKSNLNVKSPSKNFADPDREGYRVTQSNISQAWNMRSRTFPHLSSLFYMG